MKHIFGGDLLIAKNISYENDLLISLGEDERHKGLLNFYNINKEKYDYINKNYAQVNFLVLCHDSLKDKIPSL